MFKDKAKAKHLMLVQQTLSSSEELIVSFYATIITNGDLGTDGGALVVTSERVVFSGGATLMGTHSSVSVRLSQILGVSSGQRMIKGGLIQPYLEMNVGGAVYFFNLKPSDATDAQRAIEHAKNLASDSSSPSIASSNANPSKVDELERLAALFKDGLLTEEEYGIAKKKLLG